jgi:3-hydroxyacyl-[acyl-carrier-protein] dehydratase
MDVEILRVSRGIWKYKATASVDGKVAVEGELMCTIRANENAAAATTAVPGAGQ